MQRLTHPFRVRARIPNARAEAQHRQRHPHHGKPREPTRSRPQVCIARALNQHVPAGVGRAVREALPSLSGERVEVVASHEGTLVHLTIRSGRCIQQHASRVKDSERIVVERRAQKAGLHAPDSVRPEKEDGEEYEGENISAVAAAVIVVVMDDLPEAHEQQNVHIDLAPPAKEISSQKGPRSRHDCCQGTKDGT